ncbi:GDSL-type esterase/lipase family protein [Roseibium litorale]|uniref:GDSL family lipase n=1 Tax=Roseibium litorale TaxID=2803841 RepID=A0ABR9CTZ2_9HYPH|nr:GDSL-type esterase/lipase family protein [Roseibium litorale]MBD8893875.1 GDSL family lipase [Roseibium litorale]
MSLPTEPVSVVCFGDSLTWGFKPGERTRYGHSVRWTRHLAKVLGEGFYVVEDGVNGRTTVFDDPMRGDKNGFAHLATARKAHMPVGILVIMLGTNDLQSRFNMTAGAIGSAMSRLLYSVSLPTDDPDGQPPKVLLISPPPLGNFEGSPLAFAFCEKSIAESRKLKEVYAAAAAQYGAAFFDAGSVVTVSKVDSVHWDADMQAPFAEAVAAEVRKLAGG